MRRISVGIAMAVVVALQLVTLFGILTHQNASKVAAAPTATATTLRPVVTAAPPRLAPATTIAAPAVPSESVIPGLTAFGIQVDVTAINTLRIDDQTLAFELATQLTNVGTDGAVRVPSPAIACGSSNHNAAAESILRRTEFGEGAAGFDAKINPGTTVTRWLDPVLMELPTKGECEDGIWLVLRFFPVNKSDPGPNGYYDVQDRAAGLLAVDLRGLIANAPPFPTEALTSAKGCALLNLPSVKRKVGAKAIKERPFCALVDQANNLVSLTIVAEPRLIAAARADIVRVGQPIEVLQGEGFTDGHRLFVFANGTVTKIELAPTVSDQPGTLSDLGRTLGLLPGPPA
jgi:hypothetical protein